MTRDEQWLLEEKYGGTANAQYEKDKKRLARGEPLAYVIGYQPFLGLKIFLDSKPLIPRPETEWWTEKLLEDAMKCEPAGRKMEVRLGQAARSDSIFRPVGEHPLRVLDLCAGSGAIGCAALARLPNAQVHFGEIDPAHETTILKNIRENNLDESRSSVRIGDLFAPFEGLAFDIIAANPPYVPAERALPENVARHEPERALRAGTDGLGVIRRIALELDAYLAAHGAAWIECDSAHAQAAQELFVAQGFRVEMRNDQYGRSRILVVAR